MNQDNRNAYCLIEQELLSLGFKAKNLGNDFLAYVIYMAALEANKKADDCFYKANLKNNA